MSFWFPAVLLTDPRVRCERVDAETALLAVPGADGEERFVVRFDREADGVAKTLWASHARGWGDVRGHTVVNDAALT